MNKQIHIPIREEYTAPQIETIDMLVESGFAATGVTGENSTEEDY